MLRDWLPLGAGVALIVFALVLLVRSRNRFWEAEARVREVEDQARRNEAFQEHVGAVEEANLGLKGRIAALEEAERTVQTEMRRQQQLIELSQAVTGTLDRKALLPALMKKVRETFAFQSIGIFLYTADQTELQLAARDGLHPSQMEAQLSSEMGIPAIVATTRKPMLVSEAESDPRFAELLQKAEVHSALYHPIALEKHVHGVVCLWHKDRNAYTQRDLDFLGLVCGEAARALRNAEMYSELDARLNFIVTLWEASKNLNTSSVESDARSWRKQLDEVVASAAWLFGAEKAVLFRYDKGRRDLGVDLARGFDPARGPRLAAAVNQSQQGLPFFLRSPFQCKALGKDERFSDLQPVASAEGLHGMLWAPLNGRQRTVGALALFTSAPRVWTQMEMQWLDIFAGMLTVTLENISLFQDLASEKTQLQVLIDNVPEGVFTADAAGRVLTWNAAAMAITGWSLSEVSGRPCADFIRCQTVDEVWCGEKCPLKLAMDGAARYDSGVQNLAVVHRDGTRVPVFITSGPIRDEEGRIVGSILVFRDITKEKEIEQMKEDFLATITHDLKSPLASVMGYAELLLNPRLGEVNPGHREFIDAILRSSKTLQFLIDNILEITRMEAGQMTFNPGIFNLGTLIAEIQEMFLPLAAPKALRLDVEMEPAVIVRGDRDKLKEVFINLYSNAIKFTRPNGRILVQIQCAEDRATISFSDTGKGIAADQLARLFEKFAQVKSDEKRGTGLGLYIVRRILQAHGEEIEVSSEVGVGTTFRFGLARARTDGAENGQSAVLVVERDEETSEGVRRTLEEEGITTMLANSARDALRAVREGKPQLLVIDSQLPEIASENLLDELRAASSTEGHSLRVLLLCDWREESSPDADMHIYRPLDANELLRKVRALIQT
jgi:PAS domain S-box-containing protein